MHEDLPRPPIGVIDSLRMGFETLARQPAVFALPLVVDVGLWIGPRLSIRGFALPAVEGFLEALTAQPVEMAGAAQALGDLQAGLEYFAAHFNALSMLATAPLGVPSLMGRFAPEATPAGVSPPAWELGSAAVATLVVVALALLGILLGAVYLGLLSNLVRHGALRVGAMMRDLPARWASLAGLALVALSAVMIVFAPFMLVASMLAMFSPLLSLVALTMGLSAALWVMVFMLFAAHTMFLWNRALFAAIAQSLRVVRLHMGSTLVLLLLVGVVYLGTGQIFRLLTPDSWLMLAGLALHAIVATGLFLATFIYYKDRCRHYEEFYAYLAANRRLMKQP